MLACPALVARPQSCSASRIKPGRDEPIAAIVLHPIQGPLESLEAAMGTPLPAFCTGHVNPLSVHFMVSDLFAIQYAELHSVTYGLDYFKNPTWPGLNELLPLDDPNDPFIHIAIKTDCSLVALINLICCIQLELGFAVPVIASHDLQSDREEYLLPEMLTSQIADCVASNGLPEPPDWRDLWKRVQELEVCCFSNSARISKLEQRVSKNEMDIARHTLQITQINKVIVELQTAVGVIPSILETIRIIQEQISNIIENCCPETLPSEACFNYQLLSGQEQVITPNQPVHLNPPTKVIDTEPPMVTVGPAHARPGVNRVEHVI